MWLENDVSYSTESRNPDYEDPYRSESSMVIEDGFIYFYDCDGISPSKLSNKYCWFKAKKANTTLFQTKIITNPSELLNPEGFSL